jgi:hypothetical protein
MMSVVAIIMIVASISAIPIYHRTVVLSREVVLREHLFTLRSLTDRFTLDNKRPPVSLLLLRKPLLQPESLTRASSQTPREQLPDPSG